MNKHQHLHLEVLVNTTQTAAASMTQSPTSQVILPQNINKERVPLKLNRLNEKHARYESHKEDIENTEGTLKSATEKEEFDQIERAIKTNEESTKRLLQQKKFKKFNTLKHKPQTSHKETNLKENEKGRPTRTYANALVQGPRRRSPSQENKQKTERDQFVFTTSNSLFFTLRNGIPR